MTVPARMKIRATPADECRALGRRIAEAQDALRDRVAEYVDAAELGHALPGKLRRVDGAIRELRETLVGVGKL